MSRAGLRRYFRHGLFPQLVVFEAVARLGSVTRAAEALHLAQPTVSTQLKKLAQALELRLFEPDGRRLKITPAGEALLPACREIMQVLEQAEERLARLRAAECESPCPGAPAEARDAASRLLAEFCARHPGVRASLLAGTAADFVREALTGAAYNPADGTPEKEPWTSPATTTRR